MDADELRRLAAEDWARFNAHDLSEIEDRVAPGFVNHNAAPGTPDGPEGFAQVAERLWSAFPDMRFEVEEIFVAEDRVAVLGWMSGTQKGQFGPFPPSDEEFRVRQIHTYRYGEDQRLTEHLAVRDDVAMMQQLGHMPAPG